MSAPVRRTRIAQRALPVACAAALLAACASPSRAATAPPPYTGEPEQVSFTAATLKGTVFPRSQPTDYYFQYGPTAAYGMQTPPTPTGLGQLIHVTAVVAGLAAGSTYHCRLVISGPDGVLSGPDRAFVTRSVPLSFAVLARPSPVPFQTSFTISGTVSGTGDAGLALALEANPFPYRFGFHELLAPALTDASGHFAFVLAGLQRSTQLRVAALRTPSAVSPIVVQLVAARVAIHARATPRHGFVILYGRVEPRKPRAIVRLQWLGPGGRQVIVATTSTQRGNASSSRFARVIRVRHAGLYRAVVVTAGAQISGHSRPIRIG